MKKVLLAGATGYLGQYILQQLIQRGIPTTALVRNPDKIPAGLPQHPSLNIIQAEITRPEELTGCCKEIDTVISTVGITRQKDGLTYMDVDYQANLNLLQEAVHAGVRKFIYVSVLNGNKMQSTKICQAKEKFVSALRASGLEYCIIRPNGYFSDMQDFLKMAQSGRVYLFGKGNNKMNPIHGEDLATKCLEAIHITETEINIGGPQTFTHNDIAALAFQVLHKRVKIIHLPDWLRKLTLFLLRSFTSSKTYGPIEFFLTAMSMDMIAPEYGTHELGIFWKDASANL